MGASFNHRCVRDLAWAIGSPPLLAFTAEDALWPDSHWYAHQWQGVAEQFAYLDEAPSLLIEHCQEFCGDNSRLGRYFEALLAFWFTHDPRYELLHHDLQIHVDGRTVGAFDFIVREQATGETLHIEVAIKFYLGAGDGLGGSAWLGPNRKDNLQRKFDHLVKAQSRLSLLPEVSQQLLDRGLRIDRRIVMLKGRLFYPAAGDTGLPEHLCVEHLQGQWWLRQAFYRNFSAAALRWVLLEKDDWLSTQMSSDERQGLTLAELKECWDERLLLWPCCLAAMQDGAELFRVFVVPDGWGDG